MSLTDDHDPSADCSRIPKTRTVNRDLSNAGAVRGRQGAGVRNGTCAGRAGRPHGAPAAGSAAPRPPAGWIRTSVRAPDRSVPSCRHGPLLPGLTDAKKSRVSSAIHPSWNHRSTAGRDLLHPRITLAGGKGHTTFEITATPRASRDTCRRVPVPCELGSKELRGDIHFVVKAAPLSRLLVHDQEPGRALLGTCVQVCHQASVSTQGSLRLVPTEGATVSSDLCCRLDTPAKDRTLHSRRVLASRATFRLSFRYGP